MPTGETGLGIAPANRISLAAINTWVDQVQYAASTLRSLMNSLIAQGWQGIEFWNRERGHYSDRVLRAIANGYVAPPTDFTAARLERCDFNTLRQTYISLTAKEIQASGLPINQAYLDQALRSQIEHLPSQYLNLSHQRDAFLELVRLWFGLDEWEGVIAKLLPDPIDAIVEPASLDVALIRFVQQALPSYTGYPHQREALLRLVQRWHQLDTRETTILALKQGSFPASDLTALDSALIAFVQRLPRLYQGKGEQRNALVEGFRLWQHLDSRPDALVALGVNPDVFSGATPKLAEIANSTAQTDRALLDFVQRIPAIYTTADHQRDALIHLIQLWRNLPTQAQTIQSLFDDLRRLETARRDSPDVPLPPIPVLLSDRTPDWTPETVQLHTPILPNGSFTWADATWGGIYLPENQRVVDAIAHMAELAQLARDCLSRPLSIVCWYCPADAVLPINPMFNHRHALGDAIVLYCDGLTGNQLYWFLNPWWTGGLGHFPDYPYLCYIDARYDRVRWRSLS
ncbi:MAG: peptidase M15A [Leptolyngbyaceae cyanobacterium RU_5_1]|nr:peptidase M15A [Leptolyngbyaceae cyanobacterium RU_5_1]